LQKALGVGTVALGINRTVLPFAEGTPQLAITIDDFNLFGASGSIAEKRNRALLEA